MSIFHPPGPHEKEWAALMRKEAALRRKRETEPPSLLSGLLTDKIPAKLEGTLTTAFQKAFHLVFTKGTPLIEKTYSKERHAQAYEISAYKAALRQDRKSLKAFSKKAKAQAGQSVLLSGVEGVGLGLLGVGLPDIPLFSGVLLRSLYQVAMSFGFDYEGEEEQLFLLLLIETALRQGDAFLVNDNILNHWIDWGKTPPQPVEAQLDRASEALSAHLLYMKFIQGIPIIGAAGGLSDSLCLHRITEYATLKYRRRFLRQLRPPYLPEKLD